jgi:hypothetical protein
LVWGCGALTRLHVVEGEIAAEQMAHANIAEQLEATRQNAAIAHARIYTLEGQLTASSAAASCDCGSGGSGGGSSCGSNGGAGAGGGGASGSSSGGGGGGSGSGVTAATRVNIDALRARPVVGHAVDVAADDVVILIRQGLGGSNSWVVVGALALSYHLPVSPVVTQCHPVPICVNRINCSASSAAFRRADVSSHPSQLPFCCHAVTLSRMNCLFPPPRLSASLSLWWHF